jgi:hypothetical protein
MKRVNVWLAALAAVVGLSGCGGGGDDGPSYSITLTASSITFDTAQFVSPPTQAVGVTFNGAGVVVGTPPGQALPVWLELGTAQTQSATQVVVPMRVLNNNLTPGSYETTLRFVTGDAGGERVAYADLQVRLSLREGLTVTPSSTIVFEGVEGSNVISARTGTSLAIRGAGLTWSAQGPSWATVSPSSGTAAATVTVSANAAGLALGGYSDTIRITDSITGRTVSTPIVLNVSRPVPSVSASSLEFTIDNNSDETALVRTIRISDTALGQNASQAYTWQTAQFYSTIRSTPNLLRISPSSGTTAGAPRDIEVRVDSRLLSGFASGTYTIPLRVLFARGAGEGGEQLIPVTVVVRMPRAGSFEPYQIPAATPTTVRVIGKDMRSEDLARLRLNGATLPAGASAALVAPDELSIVLPAMGAGQYALTLTNTLGIARSVAELRVHGVAPVAQPAFIGGVGNRAHLVYDDTRAALYAANTSSSTLESYRWTASGWVSLGAVSLPGLRTLDAMRDGRRLLLGATGGIYTVDLDAPVAATQLTPAPFLACFSAPSTLVASEYGSLFGTVFGNPCLDQGNTVEYDLLNGSHDAPIVSGSSYGQYPEWRDFSAAVAVSGDGRHIAVGTTSVSPGTFYFFDVRARTRGFLINSDTAPGVPDARNLISHRRMLFDYAGTKLLINNGVMRARNGSTLGNLPENIAAAISRDGARAVTYSLNSNPSTGGIVRVFDITTPVGLTGTYPQIGSDIAVPQDLGLPDSNFTYNNVSSYGLTLSRDLRLAFVAGPEGIVAMQLPQM